MSPFLIKFYTRSFIHDTSKYRICSQFYSMFSSVQYVQYVQYILQFENSWYGAAIISLFIVSFKINQALKNCRVGTENVLCYSSQI